MKSTQKETMEKDDSEKNINKSAVPYIVPAHISNAQQPLYSFTIPLCIKKQDYFCP